MIVAEGFTGGVVYRVPLTRLDARKPLLWPYAEIDGLTLAKITRDRLPSVKIMATSGDPATR